MSLLRRSTIVSEMVPVITDPCRIHVVGVGGAGMSAIAEVLASMGHDVQSTASVTVVSINCDKLFEPP